MDQKEILDFLRKNTQLLEDGNFDELYYRYGQEFYNIKTCTPLTALLIDAGIVPLDYLNTIPDQYARRYKLITKVVIPENIKSIGKWAFQDCTGLTSVNIGNGVTNIGGYAFAGCKGLTSVTIPDSVTSIGAEAFSDCTGLTSIIIPNSVTSIGYGAFYRCTELTSVTISESVTSIGEFAFSYCTGLTNVTIPNSVVKIGRYAFNNPAAIKYEGTKKEWYKISKQRHWNGGIQKYTIHCTDGDVKGVRR